MDMLVKDECGVTKEYQFFLFCLNIMRMQKALVARMYWINGINMV